MNRLSWRLGWRSLWKRPGLTILLVMSMAVAVAAVALTATVQATSRFGPDELGPMFTGQADYIVRSGQSVHAETAPASTIVGSRGTLVPDRDIPAEVTAPGGMSVQTTGRLLDLSHPLTRGLYTITGGTPGPDGISLSTALASRLGVSVGEKVSLFGISDDVTVTSLLGIPFDLTQEFFILGPNSVSGSVIAAIPDVGRPRWLLGDVSSPAVVDDLTEAGYTVTSRNVLLESDEQSREEAGTPWLLLAAVCAVCAAVVATGLAVHARRLREYSELLSTLGARRSTTIKAGMVSGTVIAVVGSLLGSALGLVASGPVARVLARSAHQDWGRLDLAWGATGCAVVGTFLLSGVVCYLATRERMRKSSGSRYVLVVTALGFVGAVIVLGFPDSILALPALLLVSVCLLFLLAVGGVAAVVHAGLGFRFRLASGSLSRTSGSAHAGIIAIALVLLVSVAVSQTVHSAAIRQKESYTSSVPSGSALVTLREQLDDDELSKLARGLGTDVARFSPAALRVEDSAIPLVVDSDFEKCLRDASDADACFSDGLAGITSRGVAVVPTLTEAQILAGTELTSHQRDAFINGDGLLLSVESKMSNAGAGSEGEDGDQQADTANQTTNLVIPGRAQKQNPDISPIPVTPAIVTVPRLFQATPVMILSPAAAARLGIEVMPSGEAYSLISSPASGQLNQSSIHSALPKGAAAEAIIVIEQGPALQSALDSIEAVVNLAGPILALLIALLFTTLWTLDMRSDLDRLNQMGAAQRDSAIVAGLRSALPVAIALGSGSVFVPVLLAELRYTLEIDIPPMPLGQVGVFWILLPIVGFCAAIAGRVVMPLPNGRRRRN